MDNVVIAGVGIHPFGRFPTTYREIGATAVREVLSDSGLGLDDLDMVLVANVGAEMAKGQNVIELVGRPGIPILNVEAACASSAGTLTMASSLIESGAAHAVLCLGVEKAPRGFIAGAGFEEWQIASGIGVNPLYFAVGALDLLSQTDATVGDLADVSVKNHLHALHNENAMFRAEVTREQVLASRSVCPPLTLLMLCAPNEGAAAAILVSHEFAARKGIDATVRLRAIATVSRTADDWFVPAPARQTDSMTSITARAAGWAYEQSGLGPEDLDLVECQDTDSASELWAYRDLGLCPAGDEAKLLRSGDTRLGGRVPVNPSGGLLSKGEPLGASGLGQVHEVVQQLRGRSAARQVDGARIGLTHVMGAGHNASVAVITRG